jgi:hypothetical protein
MLAPHTSVFSSSCLIHQVSIEPSLKARKQFPQVGNKVSEFRIPKVQCFAVCSENVIFMPLDNFTSCEYS